jgi:uncharacterized glyoxalase superfamily protein PhnB
MRFMMLMIPHGYEKAAPDALPDPKAVAAMMKYNQELSKAGVLLSLDGLHPPSAGARVSFAGGKPTVTDGPFAEAKEVLGGYWMIQVASREEAIGWAKRCPASGNEVIEVRQVQELSEFPAELQEAAGGVTLGAQGAAEVQPYLFFEGRCEEAMAFYKSALGAEVMALIRYKEGPESPPGRLPPGSENKVMHGAMKIGKSLVSMSDGGCSGKPTFDGVSLTYTAANDAEAERVFGALASEGQVQQPLVKTFFSSKFGMLTDRFGLGWMVNVGR